MCKWGTTKTLEVVIPAHLSSTGKEKLKPIGIDSCIYDLVKVLNDNGFTTIASCCGHGHRPGDIALGDKRELIIAKDFEEARKIDAIFPCDIHGVRNK